VVTGRPNDMASRVDDDGPRGALKEALRGNRAA
jgi:hypothetical protein